MALSTNCRKCRVHFQIENGKALPPKSTDGPRLRAVSPLEVEPVIEDKPALPETVAVRRPSDTPPPIGDDESAIKSGERPDYLGSKDDPDDDSIKRRFVECFQCEGGGKTTLTASSANCSTCGSYISLKDFDIQDKWSRQIQTRGNVIIQKKGIVLGVTVQSHDLTVHGQISGGVDCSGDFTITRHSKILDNVRCKKLIISKRAKVEFTKNVVCDFVHIDGHVTGSLTCKGKVELAAKSQLVGDLIASSLAISKGARHSGAIQTYQAPPS